MKTLLNFRKITAENDTPEKLVDVANAESGEGVFEIAQRDTLVVPYGEYPHAKGLQKFDKPSAEILCAAFNSLGGKISRIFNPGVPIYRGHPDVPGRPDSDPAAPAVGWVQGITAENDGMHLATKWNENGDRCISNAEFRFYSPHWLLRQVKGGIQPVKLLSIGLTNNPRIPVPAIANDGDAPNEKDENIMPQWLLEMLGLGAEATEETAKSALAEKIKLAAKAQDFADAHAKLKAKSEETEKAHEKLSKAHDEMSKAHSALTTKAANDATVAQTEIDALKGQLSVANDAVTTARTARIAGELSHLVGAGKVTAAEKEGLQTELLGIANDAELSTRLDALAKAEPKIKTESATKNLGAEKSKLMAAENDAAERGEKIREAVSKELISIPNDLSPAKRYDLATERAKKAHPELFNTAHASV